MRLLSTYKESSEGRKTVLDKDRKETSKRGALGSFGGANGDGAAEEQRIGQQRPG